MNVISYYSQWHYEVASVQLYAHDNWGTQQEELEL